MAAWLDANIFVIFGTNFAQLKSGAHLTVQFVLLLGHPDVIFWGLHDSLGQVWIHIATIRKAVTRVSKN